MFEQLAQEADVRMILAGKLDMASEMLTLANIEPMTYKHHIVIEGQPFAAYATQQYSEIRDDLKEITLQWRDNAMASAGWKSIRELAASEIANPQSHLDWAWNAAVDAAKTWAAKNQLKPLSISSVARIAFAERNVLLSGADFRSRNAIVKMWGTYWDKARKNGTVETGDHSFIYRKATEWGKQATPTEIAALLVWRPKNPESSGFNLKWHAVFAAGRGAEVLGLRPCVAEAVKDLQDELLLARLEESLVSAMLDAIR